MLKLWLILAAVLIVMYEENVHAYLYDNQQRTRERQPQEPIMPSIPKERTYNDIYKIITGNPYVHYSNAMQRKKRPYPRQPFWTFEVKPI